MTLVNSTIEQDNYIFPFLSHNNIIDDTNHDDDDN